MKNGKTCFGVIIGTRAYFNSELAKDVRKQLLKTLEDGGYEYIILPEDATPTGSSSIETREDGLKVSKQFREHRDEIDGIIVSLPNFGFEIGIINAISDADLNVPVLVQACDDENDKVDLDSRRDAFCGKISVCNNLYQYGIPFTDTTLHTYSIYDPLLRKDIDRFAAICRVVNGLRHCRLGQIGTRPLGFVHQKSCYSAQASPLFLLTSARSFMLPRRSATTIPNLSRCVIVPAITPRCPTAIRRS